MTHLHFRALQCIHKVLTQFQLIYGTLSKINSPTHWQYRHLHPNLEAFVCAIGTLVQLNTSE